MARRIRGFDWAKTSLGPISRWGPELKLYASLVVDNAFPAALAWGPDLTMIYNDSFRPILGNKPEALGRSFADVWSEAWSQIGPIAGRALAGEATFIENYPLIIERSGKPEQTYFTFSYSPLRSVDGTILGMMDTVMETTSNVRASQALRESEERLRQFGEAASDVLWVRDAQTLRWEYLTPAFETIYGMTRAEALSGDTLRNWLELVLPEDREHVTGQIQRVREGQRASFEYRIRRPNDGQIRWLRNTDFPIRDQMGEVKRIGGVGHDVTELKEAEGLQRFLLAELQHRVRNTMAIVRSIVRRSVARSRSVDELGMHLDGRIAAFARVQAAVTRDPSSGLDLAALAADTLMTAFARESDRVTIDGPRVELTVRAAETIGLALHELTTNAVKFGALSTRSGRVEIRWRTVSAGSYTPLLELEWNETGVKLKAPESVREGFGTELLMRTLPYDLQAVVDRDFTPDGVRYRIRLPATPTILQNQSSA
ncbi:MAG: PAS domain S-box protein [Rhizobiales bacterium]|nr:PAS domain S-box protein [Hyphomicrobiales bacterium]